MKNVFQNEIVDGCLVKQLYTMTEDNDNKDILPFIKNDIDILLASMSYVEDNLLIMLSRRVIIKLLILIEES